MLQTCFVEEPAGRVSGLCLSCGAELSSVPFEQLSQRGLPPCTQCSGQAAPFTRIVAPYRYEFPVDRLIQSLKYREQRVLARIFGTLLARSVQRQHPTGHALPELLLPVPLHATRLRQRGFNQSAEIARWCGRELGVESRARAVTREYDTGSLAGLSRAERQYRILGAFRAQEALADRHVAIIDDVLTTGSTTRELARELYDTGVASVELWVLARTSSAR
ncbi:ComF family protein [Granulosicoccus sp. 3-233]